MGPSRLRQEIVRRLVDGLPEPPVAAALSGSSALGTAREGSDIDLMLVVARDRARTLFPGTDPEALVLFESGGLGIFWHRSEQQGIETNCFVYSPEGLTEHCLLRSPLVAWKQGRRLGDLSRGHAFDGTLLEFARDVRPLGSGWLYDRPALAGGRYWGGVPKQSLLEGSMPFAGAGWWDALAEETWRVTVGQLLQEEEGLVPGTLSVLNTHWTRNTAPERYPAAAAGRMAEEEARWRKALREPAP